ncbi:MarR family winged helix-turn-helix transcriptional regulator [Lactobacillus sp. wkB10]|uniref:MarR family winged helix-turn-helix transcriptional regulator n=1 Tax=Lactobacillus sp. wkB10 TaxID=1545701 RepID=UPI000512DA34|nr:MarR family winged helix-turn-helix transcriptional regulator [Lactobacillus sp. wkB10]KGG54978.1 transcriptional repressor, MarR family [Lactobacillus sp. wkB10]
MKNNKLYQTLMDLQCELVAERNLVNPGQINWLQYDILSVLQDHARKPTVLSRQLGIKQAKLSKNFTKLRKLGYIKQTPDIQDHRELITEITAKGLTFMDDIAEKHGELYNKAQKIWSKKEQEQFILLANKLIAVLRKDRIGNE